MRTFTIVAALAALGASQSTQGKEEQTNSSTTIELVFNDPPGIGFNAAGTLGDQRRSMMRAAAQQWNDRLISRTSSPAPLRIRANFSAVGEIPCSEPARGGPVDWIANFPNAPRANTLYPIALAEHLRGTNLQSGSGTPEMWVTFNSFAGCTNNAQFHYQPTVPPIVQLPNNYHFRTVALRMIARGLGFTTQMCLRPAGCGNGVLSWPAGGYQNLAGQSFVDLWAHYLRVAPNATLSWAQMSNAQRFSAASSFGVIWDGPLGTEAVSFFGLGGTVSNNGQNRIFSTGPADEDRSIQYFGYSSTEAPRDRLMEVDRRGIVNENLDLTPVILEEIGWRMRQESKVEILSVSAPGSVAGSSFRVEVRVSGPTGIPAGNVSISDGNGGSCTVVNPGQAGFCNMIIRRAGTNTVTASFLGTTNHFPSTTSTTIFLQRAGTTLNYLGTTPLTPIVGQPTTVRATVNAVSPSVVNPTSGIIRVRGGFSGEECNITLPAESCQIAFQQGGQRAINLEFLGTADHLPSTTIASVHPKFGTTVSFSAPNGPVLVGVGTTFTATVNATVPPGGNPATGIVKIISTSTNEECGFALPANSCTLTFTSPGNRTFVATYFGDNSYSSNNSAPQTVAVVTPEISGLRAIGCGSPVTFAFIWNEIPGISKYEVEQITTSAPAFSGKVSAVRTTPIHHPWTGDLPGWGDGANVRVRACSATGCGPWSASVYATTLCNS